MTEKRQPRLDYFDSKSQNKVVVTNVYLNVI
jgi:hypothetical protein